MAYLLWRTLTASCRQAGLGDEPRQVFEALSEIAQVDVVLPARSGTLIRKRCISQPTGHQRILPHRPGLRLPTALETAAMKWKLGHLSVESKDLILQTAEVGLKPAQQ